MAGHRVRVLAEWYDAATSAEAADVLAGQIQAVLAAQFPQLLLVTYVEPDPPEDEVELRPGASPPPARGDCFTPP